MCQRCEPSHKQPFFSRKHKTRAVNKQCEINKSTKCPKHETKEQDVLCVDCNLLLCSKCVFKNHRNHNCVDIDEKMQYFSGQLNNVLVQTDQALETIYKAIKITQEQSVKVKADVRKLKQQTSAAYRAILRYVEEQEEGHLASIDDNYQQAEKVIAETLKKQETLAAALNSIQMYGQHLSKGSTYDLTTNLKSLVKRSDDELSKSVPELRWKVDLIWSEWGVNARVDRAVLTRESGINLRTHEQMTAVTSHSVGKDDRRESQRYSFNTHHNGDITGMLSYNNHLFITYQGHGTLYVYEKGTLKQSVNISHGRCKMTWPMGVCLSRIGSNVNRLVISDHDGHCLWWLDLGIYGNHIELGKPRYHKLQYLPGRISSDSSGRVLATDEERAHVYVYSKPGMCISRV